MVAVEQNIFLVLRLKSFDTYNSLNMVCFCNIGLYTGLGEQRHPSAENYEQQIGYLDGKYIQHLIIRIPIFNNIKESKLLSIQQQYPLNHSSVHLSQI